ncbi:MAG TPA: DUF3455 domain-containing protein [Polyangia bacterium]
MSVGCPAEWTATPSADPSIALPANGGSLILHAAASGTQNYVCTSSDVDAGDGKSYSWTLVAPAATLADCAGSPIGMHSAPTGAANPQWTNNDGSVVVGHKVTSFTPDSTAIAWLLLAATSHSGDGIMSRVHYVQRLNSKGGLPSGACDATHVGATDDSFYTADYYFFGD